VKIIIYCQHVLGLGHFFRTLEIARAMETFDVILVTGGGRVEVRLPDHVRNVKLPGLMMDKNFTGLYSVNPQKSLKDVKLERQKQLLDLVKKENPDFFLIELYPFGRRAFRFELIPVLNFIKANRRMSCKVVCSMRDILVERQDRLKYESGVIDSLNNWFDAVLVHSDPHLIKLDSTFSRLDKLKIPLVYTGFVTPVPDKKKVKQIRQNLRLQNKKRLIVASAGGGNVGAPLLRAVVNAYNQLALKENLMLHVYTGPYMEKEDKQYLQSVADSRVSSDAGSGIRVKEFTSDFVSLLGAADLSVSMAGYNTCMNIVAANVPSLVWPFGQNQEQRERARGIARFVPMTILEDQDLMLPKFSRLIEKSLYKQNMNKHLTLNIHGAFNTMKWIRSK
jgi:predicted glycosyltransferase